MFGSEDYVVTVCFCPVTCTVQYVSAILIENNGDSILIGAVSVDRCFYRICHLAYVRPYRVRPYPIPYMSSTGPDLAHMRGSPLAPPNIRYCTCVLGQTMLYLKQLISHARNPPLHDLAITLAEQK